MALAAAAQITFSGNSRDVMEIEPEFSTGLKRIFVLNSAEGVSMTYTATTENPVTWSVYDEMGGAYATEVEGVEFNGLESTLHNVKADCGYIITEGTTPYYFWVTDYSKHMFSISSVDARSDGDCSTVTINVDGQGADIPYFTITGVRKVLSRDIKLSYQNLAWSDDEHWHSVDTVETLESLKPTIVIPAPLCNTTFTISGDRFLEFWDMASVKSKTSDLYVTAAVDAHATATQESRDNPNEQKSGDEMSLGGSAPVHIYFQSFVTDAVVHREWQMATDADFNDIVLRINQDDYEETFNDAGEYYWRFVAANADGTCETISETFTVNVGVSVLQIPNVFTPGVTEGQNDIWMVSYSSITEFHCWIYNRWGVLMCEFTDPAQGWDGYYKGKLVPTGVYYYVIQARGSDGQKYNRSGDINVIRYRKNEAPDINPNPNPDIVPDGDGQ